MEFTSEILQLAWQGCSVGHELDIWQASCPGEWAVSESIWPESCCQIRSKQDVPVGEVSVLSLPRQQHMEERAGTFSASGQDKPGTIQNPDQAFLDSQVS